MRHSVRTSLGALLLAGVGGCSGVIGGGSTGGPGNSGSGNTGAVSAGNGGSTGTGNSGSMGTGSGGSAATQAIACSPGIPATTQLRRMLNTQYDATVRDRVWTLKGSRERCRIEFAEDGDTMTTHWDRSADGVEWQPLCDITARKVSL